MRLSLIVGLCIVFCGALVAQAEIVTWAGGSDPALVGSLSATRTTYSSSIDEIDIHFANPVTLGGVDQKCQLLEGMFSVPAGSFIDLKGTALTWKANTANGLGVPVAPQSYVNLDVANSKGVFAVTPAWSGTGGLLYSSMTGSWYTGYDGGTEAGGIDLRLFSGGDSSQGIDTTLLAKVFVSTGAPVTFAGDASWGGWGFSHSYNIGGGFTVGVPEPATLMLAFGGLVGLVCYAWRKRR